jgi:hypothetical protein
MPTATYVVAMSFNNNIDPDLFREEKTEMHVDHLSKSGTQNFKPLVTTIRKRFE